MCSHIFFQHSGASDCLAKSYKISKSFLIIDFLLFSFCEQYFRSERRAGITERIRSRKQEATVRLIKRISSPLLGLQVRKPSSFSLPSLPQLRTGRVRSKKHEATVRLPPPGRTDFILLPPPVPTSIKDRDYQIQEA